MSGGVPELGVRPHGMFPVGNASFFRVLQVIEVLDDSHLMRGTPNGRHAIGVGAPQAWQSVAARAVALAQVSNDLRLIFVVFQVSEMPHESHLIRSEIIGASQVSIISRIEGAT